LKRVRGWLDSFEAEFTNHLNALYEAGVGAPASDLHTRNQGCSAREARAKEARAKALADATAFGDALADGEIGAEHADALANATSKLDEDLKDEFLGHEASLLDEAKHSSPEQFGRHCRSLLDRLRRDHGVERDKRQRQNTSLRRRIDANGMHVLNGEFHPELGAAIWAALDAEIAARLAASGDRTVDRQQLAAEALGALVSGGHQQARSTVTEVSVLIDLQTLLDGLHEHSICELSDGSPLPVQTVRRMCCDADIIPIVLDGDGVAVDQGRSQRRANRKQRRQLRAMYRDCAFDRCDTPFERCEMHHITEWDNLGPTDIANLLPLCARHHHIVHDGGWKLHLAPDRTLTITQPDGHTYATTPTHIHITGNGEPNEPDDPIDRRRQPSHQTENRNLVS